MRSLNICVITQQIGKIFSGPGLHAFNLVNSLIRDGHQVTVIAPKNQRPPGDLSFEFIGVPRPWFSKTQARWITLSYSFSKAVEKLEKSASFDLIHFTDAREALFCKSRVPRIGNVNDTYAAEVRSLNYYRKYYADWLQRWLYYRMVHGVEKGVLNRLDAVLANSQFTSKTIAVEYAISMERLFVCYKSVDVETWRAEILKREDRKSEGKKRILFVGTNMQRKGLPTLIKAAPIIISQFTEVEFLIIGEDKSIPVLQKLCRELNVERNFQFLGWKSQSELMDDYARADLFVLPSLTEALGVALLEAMAAGLPVIGSNVGGIPEIIKHGENGLLVSPDHPAELAQAVLRILSDKEFASHLVERGYENLSRFDLKKMMACTYEVYSVIRG